MIVAGTLTNKMAPALRKVGNIHYTLTTHTPQAKSSALSHCLMHECFMVFNRCTIRCLTLDGCCPWALAQTVEATTITPTLLSVAVTALYPSISTSQVRDTGKSEVAQRVDSLCPASVSVFSPMRAPNQAAHQLQRHCCTACCSSRKRSRATAPC